MTAPAAKDVYTAERRFVVTAAMTADAFGNEGVHVLATPYLANELELACVDAVAGLLDPASSTVGTLLSFKHLAASPVGATVVSSARLLERDDRRLLFAISARDRLDLIAEGTHERFIVNTDRFLSKVRARAETLASAEGVSP